jgi:hypothetical protein
MSAPRAVPSREPLSTTTISSPSRNVGDDAADRLLLVERPE